MDMKRALLLILFMCLVSVVCYVLYKKGRKQTSVNPTIEIEPLELNEFGDYIVLDDGSLISKY